MHNLTQAIQAFQDQNFDAPSQNLTKSEAEVMGQLFVQYCLENHLEGTLLTKFLAEIRNPDTKQFSGDRLLEWMVAQGWEVSPQTVSFKHGCTLEKGDVTLIVPFNTASPSYNSGLLNALAVVSKVENLPAKYLGSLINIKGDAFVAVGGKEWLLGLENIVRLRLKEWGTYDVTLIHNFVGAKETQRVSERQSGDGVRVTPNILILHTNQGNQWQVPTVSSTWVQVANTAITFICNTPTIGFQVLQLQAGN